MTWAGETWVITDPELALQTLMSWRQMESSLTTTTFNPYALQQERRWWRADIQSIQVYTCRPIHRPPCLLFPRPTARVLIATPSRFFLLEWLWWTDHRHHACARAVRFRCQIEHFSSTISSLYFFFSALTKTYRPEWNELENTRISRVRAPTPSSEDETKDETLLGDFLSLTQHTFSSFYFCSN